MLNDTFRNLVIAFPLIEDLASVRIHIWRLEHYQQTLCFNFANFREYFKMECFSNYLIHCYLSLKESLSEFFLFSALYKRYTSIKSHHTSSCFENP